MQTFSSPRERRLWQWALIALMGIYLTLPFVSPLASLLVDQGLVGAVFAACMFLVAVTIGALAIKARPGGLEIGVGIGLAAVYGFVFVRLTLAERSHLIEYGVVAALVYEALSERASQGRRVASPAVLAMVATSAAGLVDELMQLAVPSRRFDGMDILFNTLASVMAVLAMVALRWARRAAADRPRLPRRGRSKD